MKLLNLAISSIVDANTGNGLNRHFVDQYGSGHSSLHTQAHKIRSRSVLDLIVKIKVGIQAYVEDSKTRAIDRQATKEVLALSDSMLEDIGLTRDNLIELRNGSISLEMLDVRRDQKANERKLLLASNGVDSHIQEIESANQASYEIKKCA